ncbi:hypothetical protein PRK78_004255 [Emydomyces testavorans]|uniref:Uncharacterized protein n=1 Tax=Emydomyces testavorans TaxID=2070801 RepID=A0AAF0DHR4_9EURO|nr:hypothetical protein PRK78_004255 [Emydomyces testavorans]
MNMKAFGSSTAYEKETGIELRHRHSAAPSIASTDTAVSKTAPCAFNPSRSLFINAHGIRLVRLPLPSSELEITIHDADGSIAYISSREKRCSGDATLSSLKTGAPLLKTSYFFGPNRDPIIRPLVAATAKDIETENGGVGAPKIRVSGKWNSRSQYFTTPGGGEFRWRYVRCDDPLRWGCKTLLVLERLEDGKSGMAGGRRVAQLVRNERTRPEGTSRSTAGNGGELMVDGGVMGAEIDEALVVATCLLMLKKEIDRRRVVQMMVLGAMASGGP